MAQNGLRYRRKKREVADFLLANIDSDVFHDRIPEFLDLELNRIRLGKFENKFPGYTFQQYNSALQLLVFNKHVSLWWPEDSDPEFSDPYVSTTRQEMEAHYEGYYQKENQKDSIETFELRSRWILPVASILISLTALTLSILSYFHPKR